MQSDFLTDLNEQQRLAVRQPPGPVLVLAGPGSGKTRLLIARITWLIRQQNLAADRILAVTFTNKAAGEMKNRLYQVAGPVAEKVTISTFHSFALSILRKYHHLLGLNKFFSICSPTYQRRLLKNLCAPYIRENLEAKVSGMLLTFSNHVMKEKELSPFARERFAEYSLHLKRHQLIDFDQILIFTRKLLSEHPDILGEYQFLYPAILVDEFQDTDAVQYDLLYSLSMPQKNIFVVADDDQSIYSWRGANPENIRRFIDDFNIKPIFMEINYRNGRNILECAERIIAKTERVEPGKYLRVEKRDDDQVDVKFFLTDFEEINYVLKKIVTWQQQGIEYKQMALIYPFHRIGQVAEEFLIKNQLPYQMAEGRSLLDHPSLNKILLYLSLVRDADDPVALEELTLAELGSTLYNFIKEESIRRKLSFRKILSQLYQEEEKSISLDTRFKLRRLVAHIANLFNLKYFYSFSRLLDQIISLTEQQDNSFLTRYLTHLEPISNLATIAAVPSLPADRYRWYVHHPDKKIGFIARELVSTVLQVPVHDYPAPDETGDNLPPVILELEPAPRITDTVIQVPLYKLKNEKRSGSLSNLFKYLQWYTTQDEQVQLNRYIILDLETTDKDAHTCGLVEFAAVLVENGNIIREWTSLINPEQPISPAALAVHHITEQMVHGQPSIRDIWSDIKTFLGKEVLIAHNGFNFDFIILDRLARQIDGEKLPNRRIDTLAMARNLYADLSNSVDNLMIRLGIKSSGRHRAMNDVCILAEIFQKLQQEKLAINKKLVLEPFLDYVSLGNYIENKIERNEDHIFFINGARKLITPYSQILKKYCTQFIGEEHSIISSIRTKISELNPFTSTYNSKEQLMVRIKAMALQYDTIPVDEAIAQFLGLLSLNSAQDELEDINAISLLTYHAAKGLEFDKVIIMGLENNNMPGFHANREDSEDDRPLNKKMEEQRRLLYVGITRARTELILTVVKNRGGWQQEYSPFIKELEIPYTTG